MLNFSEAFDDDEICNNLEDKCSLVHVKHLVFFVCWFCDKNICFVLILKNISFSKIGKLFYLYKYLNFQLP